ncbi:MAG: guanylate kinase [Bacteroidaceae bacterium]
MIQATMGKLIIFSAPSGSGKSSIVHRLMQDYPEFHLAFSISATSRPPRGNEQDGVDYFFISPEEFRLRISRGEFLEYEEVYPNRFYGSLRAQIDRQLEAGQNVVFDVDVAGGCRIREIYGNRAMSIFVQPPSLEELERRLRSRNTDSQEQIAQRLGKAEQELSYAPRFDHIVVNDDFQTAVEQTASLVRDFINRKE